MNIPPKYEDVVAQLRAERELHKLATETLGQFADENQKLHADLAALREELARYKSLFGQAQKAIDRLNELHPKRMGELAKRLTVAEQLLHEVRDSGDWHSSALEFIHGEGFEVLAKIEAALKPAEEVEGS